MLSDRSVIPGDFQDLPPRGLFETIWMMFWLVLLMGLATITEVIFHNDQEMLDQLLADWERGLASH